MQCNIGHTNDLLDQALQKFYDFLFINVCSTGTCHLALTFTWCQQVPMLTMPLWAALSSQPVQLYVNNNLIKAAIRL